MTLEELSKAYYAAYWGVDTTNNNERDIAGIRAVVEALRDEMFFGDGTSTFDILDVWDLLDGILTKEAVLGGTPCQSSEQHIPETTPNDEQPS